jgi:ABC-type transport system involved in cytochrome c biogenesis permease subunit
MFMAMNERGGVVWVAACLCAVLLGFGVNAQERMPGAQDGTKSVETHGPSDGQQHGQTAAHDNDTDEADDAPAEPGDAKLDGDLDFSYIEMMAVQDGGRKKPLQTYVNEMIEQVVGRPLFGSRPHLKDPASGAKLYAMDMFLSMWFRTRVWDTVPVVLISNAGTKKTLNLDAQRTHFSMKEIKGSAAWNDLIKGAALKADAGKDREMTEDEKEAQLIYKRCEIVETLVRSPETLNIVPHPTDINGTWLTLETFFIGTHNELGKAYNYTDEHIASCTAQVKKAYGKDLEGATAQAKNLHNWYIEIGRAFYKRDALKFKEATREMGMALRKMGSFVYPSDTALSREITFNDNRPFQKSWLLYLASLVIGLAVFRVQSRAVFSLPVVLFACGLAYHLYGFVLRCLIAGRPPVTNMYESVIWVGFGCVFFGGIFDLIYRKKYYMLCGAGGAVICLVLMDMVPVLSGNPQMAGFESKINPLVPVLRDNFWLTVHVMTITLSYAAFMLAWVLGHVTLFKHLTKPAAKAEHHELHTFIYRVVQIGVLLVAIGTILGGVWAYYSWGRFWGWDPKETWAFITLLCYLVVLHGRFTGWWGNFGMSVGSVICFQSVVMAWYGVNFVLGELGNGGLHSYGAGAGGKQYVFTAVFLDMIFTAAAVTQYMMHKRAAKSAAADKDEDELLTDTDPVADARKDFATDAAGE